MRATQTIRRWHRSILTALVVAALTLSTTLGARAERTAGRVVRVIDGDTIVVLVGHTQVKVRMACIDAPESRQAFGSASKLRLSALVYLKDVTMEVQGSDRYARSIAMVYVGETNANLEMVRTGMAWVYTHYCSDPTFYKAQDEARHAHTGLWSAPNPVAPWEWRRNRKKSHRD